MRAPEALTMPVAPDDGEIEGAAPEAPTLTPPPVLPPGGPT